MHHFTIVSLFPELIEAFGDAGIVRRSRDRGIIDLAVINPRGFAADRRGSVDDAPYGGGPGMVMMAGPLCGAIRAARARVDAPAHVAYLSPQGRRFEQGCVDEIAAHRHLVLVAGRYEGIDERVIEREVDSEWSVGDYVLSGGELPAMIMVESVTRTLPGALGDARSAQQDSFCDGLLDYPHYTRPEVFEGAAVPAVLLSGDHAAIARWRRREQLRRTATRRPDLLAALDLGAEDRALLEDDSSDGVPC